MNPLVLFFLAALGIGGGLLGLLWGWREGEREAYFRRHYHGQLLMEGKWAAISTVGRDFDARTGDYVQISGNLGSNGVYQFRFSEWV